MAFSNDRWQLLAANTVMRMFAYDAGSDNVTAANYFASKWNDIRPDDMIVVSTDGALTSYRVSSIDTHSVAVEAISSGGGGGGGDGAQWHGGAGAPSSETGANGDWYLNTTNGDVYGPKAGGVWGGSVGNLRGPQGDPGAPGDPGVGVPAGGSSGQILAKASGDDHDTEWVNPPEGGGGTADDYEVVTASNPTSPYTASGLTGHTVIKITGLAGNLTINKPTGTFGAGKRFFVIYEVTASGGNRTLTFGTGISLGLGIAPSLVVASGVTNRYVLYTDDNGSTFVYDGDAAAATDTVAGPVELATAAETTGGTDATRAVTPDGLAGSVYGIRYATLYPIGGVGDDIATGDGQSWLDIPDGLNGWNLVSVRSSVATAGTTGTTDFQVRRVRAGTPADMLSTKSTIDSGETSSATAATPAVINTSNDDVATGDRIYLDTDAVSSTPPKGGCVTLGFQAP